jgi:hypothetical protein
MAEILNFGQMISSHPVLGARIKLAETLWKDSKDGL